MTAAAGDAKNVTNAASDALALKEIEKGNSHLEIEVIHEDKYFWIVDKPAGIPSHPISLFERETVTQWALAREAKVREEFPGPQPTVTPHRLDIGTSGVLIVCRTQASFQDWRQRFQSKQVQKKYLAWCYGEEQQTELFLDEPIAHSRQDARKMVVTAGTEAFREPEMEAKTNAKRLKQSGEVSLWEISCSTGVTHQIRVHLAWAGFPLVGDKLYDPLFDQRKLKPPFHQLRASEIEWQSQRFRVDSKQFEESF
ncbi:MAG: RluA family pseudouridine synthase [Proteobacteria bacterium]|nr:RluA family pseudouridine synthase [Pseudomonadota bacterium]